MKHSLLLATALLALAGCNAPQPPTLHADTGSVLPPSPSQVAPAPQIVEVGTGVVAGATAAPQGVDVSPKVQAPSVADMELATFRQTGERLGPKPHTKMVSLQNPHITVHKSATCGCCEAWIKHLEQNGFVVSVSNDADLNTFKDHMGVPGTLRSCHTGEIEGLFVEGHVPASDIRKMLSERKQNKSRHGIAVPGMPAGSPGMEMGDVKHPYEVIAVSGKQNDQKVFAKH